jgi:hypothetical protein
MAAGLRSASLPVGPVKYFYHETSQGLPYSAAPNAATWQDDKGRMR